MQSQIKNAQEALKQAIVALNSCRIVSIDNNGISKDVTPKIILDAIESCTYAIFNLDRPIKPNYLWKNVDEYAADANYPLNFAFEIGWNMARMTIPNSEG